MAYIGVSPSNGVRRVHTYTATASQTTFSGAGAEGTSLSYKDSNFVDVYQNGIKLGDADYTSTSGTSIVLAQGASVDDLVVVVVFDVFSVADTVSKADGGTFDGAVTFGGGVSGVLDADGGITVDNITIDGTEIDLSSGDLTIDSAGDIILDAADSITTPTAGTSNVKLGNNAGNSIASGGNYNVVIGDEAGTALTTGDNNVAIGYQALMTEDEHGDNTAVGYQALKTQNVGAAGYNVAIGTFAGKEITTGIKNVIVGNYGADVLTTGDMNTAIGYGALSSETKGNKSTAVGHGALIAQNITSDSDAVNTAVGYDAATSLTTGIQNTFVGAFAGSSTGVFTDHSYSVVMGYGAGQNQAAYGVAIGNETNFVTYDHSIVLGYNVDSVGANHITFGKNDGSDRVYNQFTSNASWTRVSDERYKTDIKDNTDCGLDFINDLRPVTFKWKSLSEIDESLPDYDKDKTEAEYKNKMYGLIAQEVKQAMEKHNITDFGGHDVELASGIQGISQEMFVHPLIKSVQELSAKVTALETENKTQATQIADLISRVTALENAE